MKVGWLPTDKITKSADSPFFRFLRWAIGLAIGHPVDRSTVNDSNSGKTMDSLQPSANQPTKKLYRFKCVGLAAMVGWQLSFANQWLHLGLESSCGWIVSPWTSWGITITGLAIVSLLVIRGVHCDSCGIRCQWESPCFVCPTCRCKYDPGRVRGQD